VDLGDVLRQACDTVALAAWKRGVTLEVQIERLPLSVEADAARLQQVMVNLLSNAIRHAPKDTGA
jgi:signal transduction histidine kinase